jgi:hypothetical protein
MSKVMNRYSISDINAILFNGFDYALPEETIKIISELSHKVGSPDYVKTPVFKKRENPLLKPVTDVIVKRKKGKNVEVVNDEDWNTLRNFQTTKFEKKEGVDIQIAAIKLQLNKFSDKNFLEKTALIIEIIDQIILENSEKEDFENVSAVIFEIASNNRFYSKIYANLYSTLYLKYEFMRDVFETSFSRFVELFANIEYVTPEENYDQFCKNNKDNEKRKSLSLFFINLTINAIISKVQIANLVVTLLSQVDKFSIVSNKKNEIDELIENVALLYKPKLFDCSSHDNDLLIASLTITEFITKLAGCKVQKDSNLTSKSIFKCMDMLGL